MLDNRDKTLAYYRAIKTIYDRRNEMNEDTIKVAICKDGNENSPVAEYINLDKFTPEFIKMHDNGDVWGVYYLHGDVVARDIWNEMHREILK